MRVLALRYVAALALSTAAWVQPVGATLLSGSVSVDNVFTAYLSTNDSVAGTQIGSGTDWPTTYSVGGALTDGVTNYLHILAVDQGGPRMFIGEFSLGDTGFQFSNGTQDLLTNTSNWVVSTTAFGSGYTTPIDEGPDGTSPWGNRPGIDDSARFIWGDLNVTPVYFSTTITPNDVVPPGVPEPGTLLLLGTGLLSLAGLRYRRSRAQ